MVYPKSEDKEDLFVKATENTSSHLIPDGTYVFDRLRSLTTQELQRMQMSITGAGAFWKEQDLEYMKVSVSLKKQGITVQHFL